MTCDRCESPAAYTRKYSGEKLVIADEISPDTCRLWDTKTKERLDKDVFRLEEGSLSEAYTEVANRFDLLPKNKKSALK